VHENSIAAPLADALADDAWILSDTSRRPRTSPGGDSKPGADDPVNPPCA
jgi:hypothetical protein